MSKNQIVERLVQMSKKALGGDSYTDDKAADRFVCRNDNAWLFGVIFDQGVLYERAWKAPYVLKPRLGSLSMRRIAKTPIADLRRAIKGVNPGEALHRYVEKLRLWLKKAAAIVVKDYGGEASNIWRNCRTAGEVIERLDEFPGIGKKKAHMAARLLHEDKHEFSRWSEINVPVDVHVKRVWKRTGLATDLSVVGIMHTASELKPNYPGELGYPTWTIGRGWCHARRADCRGERSEDKKPCPLFTFCPKIGVVRAS